MRMQSSLGVYGDGPGEMGCQDVGTFTLDSQFCVVRTKQVMAANRLILALKQLGFGDPEADINGADVVDAVNAQWDALTKE